MKVNVCFSPLLYSSCVDKMDDAIVVVADIFRATTSMCVALQNGATSIIPVLSAEEAKDYKKKGFLVGGERNVEKLDFADFGNTPSEYTEELVRGKEIVISTTNGTRAIDVAVDASTLLIGSFSNMSAIARYCIHQKRDVLVLCAGWQGMFNLEDTLYGGALAELLTQAGGYTAPFDTARAAISLWRDAKADVWRYMQGSEHFRRLEAHDLLDVAEFCLTSNTTTVLPIYDKKTKRITNKTIL